MGALWSALTKTSKKYVYRTWFLGPEYAGKTSILYKLKLGEVVLAMHTIGTIVETFTYQNISLTAWDHGGRDKSRLIGFHYPNTHAIVYVVDSKDKERLEQAKDELNRTMCEDDLRDVKLMVLANKQDLDGALSPDDVAKELELHSLKQDWVIFPTSAVTGEGLTEAFDWLISQVGHDDIKTTLVNPIKETMTDVQTTVESAKWKSPEFFQTPYDVLKRLRFSCTSKGDHDV